MTRKSTDQENDQSDKDVRRKRSDIEFVHPYLDDVIDLAKTVKKLGGGKCEVKQLSEAKRWEGIALRAKLNAAGKYGLIIFDDEMVFLTELGMKASEASTVRAARVEAFLRIPLNKAMFDKLNGKSLPENDKIEWMVEELGVTPKQCGNARRSFVGSILQAGLVEDLTNIVSMPSDIEYAAKEPSIEIDTEKTEANNYSTNTGIRELLEDLPDRGSIWPRAKRVRWLKAVAANFDVFYKDDEETTIEIMKIDI